MKFKFKLGQTVRCRITGFTGVVIARTQWIANCNTYNVKAKVLSDGKPLDSHAFDEPTLELINSESILQLHTPPKKTGGPVETPRRAV